MDDRDLQVKLEAIEAELATLREGRLGSRLRRASRDPKLRLVLLCATVIIPMVTYAAVIGAPYTFSNGTIADATEVNANFSALVTESNDQNSRLAALEASMAVIPTLQGQVTANTSNISTNTSQLATNTPAITTNTAQLGINTPGITANTGNIATNTAAIVGNTANIGTLNTTLAGVSRGGTPDTLTFSGMNVQVVSGSGVTDGTVNALGNLIVGYNENNFAATRTGSHNLVVGLDHTYTSYGGLVVGNRSAITGIYASVSGGYFNTASGIYSSTSGGVFAQASGDYSSVSGGRFNTASAYSSSVSGGMQNTASGGHSSVSGGQSNEAAATYSSAIGPIPVLEITGQ
jgi:hypothetical protein